MNKHTPGPWFVNDNPLKMSEYCIFAESRGTAFGASVAIANQREGRNPLSQEEARANARLIAAAPDLLKELKALLSCDPNDFEVRARARMVIEKVEGETE